MFFPTVLTKKYTNPSADIIEVLSGLDNVDAVFSDPVAALETTIKTGRDGALEIDRTQDATDQYSLHKAEGYQSSYRRGSRRLPNSSRLVLRTPRLLSGADECESLLGCSEIKLLRLP